MSYEEKPWTVHYDSGVPASLTPYPNVPLFQLLDDTAQKFPDNIACITALSLSGADVVHREVTYETLAHASDSLAASLAGMGVIKGDRVAIVMANYTQFVIAFFGILKAGAAVVALNPTFPPAKWAEQFRDSGAVAAIAMMDFYEGLNSIRGETSLRHIILTNIEEYLPDRADFLHTDASEMTDDSLATDLRDGDHGFRIFLLSILQINVRRSQSIRKSIRLSFSTLEALQAFQRRLVVPIVLLSRMQFSWDSGCLLELILQTIECWLRSPFSCVWDGCRYDFGGVPGRSDDYDPERT